MLLESNENLHSLRIRARMNRKSRQNTKNAIEKDFFKLTNNSNFGFDCKNNASNVTFEPIIDEINEISYIKKVLQSS